MGQKRASAIMLTLLLTSMLTLAFNIQPVKAEGTIYIRADGSVDPPDAPIQRDGDIYTLTGNITSDTHGIVIERDNIVVDGAGYTLQGTGASKSRGFDISGKSNITIKSLNIINFIYGIYLNCSSGSTVSANNISRADYAIYLFNSSFNTVLDNNASARSNWYYAIYIENSSHNTLRNNTLWVGGFFVHGSELSHFLHDIDTSNKKRGDYPVYYLVNERDKVIGRDSKAGYIAVINSENIIVRDMEYKLGSSLLGRNSHGVLFVHTNNSRIEKVHTSLNEYGIYLLNSFNNTILSNYLEPDGIYLLNSSGNLLMNNKVGWMIDLYNSNNNIVSNNEVNKEGLSYLYAIRLKYSSKNEISNNDISIEQANEGAIYLYDSTYNMVSSNILHGLQEDSWTRIWLVCSSYNEISGNEISYAGCGGIDLYDSQYNTVSGNSINNNKAPTYAGVVNIDDDSRLNIVSGNDIRFNQGGGVYIAGASENQIFDNTIFGNSESGITLSTYLEYSGTNNDIFNNSISFNGYGIFLRYSVSHNKVHHNNFVDNSHKPQVGAYNYYGVDNLFDDGYPSGGNYWSDYTGVDLCSGPYQNEAGSDGIGDPPYTFTCGQDRYPLMTPWPPTPNQPPVCVIKLQKNGIEISEIDVGQFFDIYVGDSADDTGIRQVRFSNDDVRDGNPTGRWTEWYDWNTSSDDWNALTKIRRWAFYTPGYKEVWAEVKDDAGQTARCSANMYVPAPALPVLISSLILSPVKDMYSVGDSLTAEFTIENIGEVPITLDSLTLGGRLNGWIQADGYPDFTHRQVTLQPGVPYQYSGSLALAQTGNYRFFVAYHVTDPNPEEEKLLDENNWNTCIELGEGLTQTARVKNIIVYEEGTLPGEPEALRETISRLIRLNPHAPPYLLGVDSWKESVATLWADLTSWATQTDLTDKYDELYYAGINYYGLRSNALHDANSALDRGDIEYAKKCVERSRTYDKLAYMSFVAASEVFDGNMEAGQVLAEGIRTGCETAVKFGVKVLFPAAGIAADGIYLITNFGLNTWIEGVDKATVDMAVDLTFMLIFQSIEFPSIGGNTLETYVNTISQNMPFTELLRNAEFMEEFGFELFNVIAQRVLVQYGITLAEWKLEEMVNAIVQRLASMGDSERSGTKCPVELRVQDSNGRVTGLFNGRVKQEIPLSLCYNGTIQIFFPSDSYSYELIGKDVGTYELTIALTKDGNTTTFDAADIPILSNATHRYTIDWAALSRGEEGVTAQVDSDGDGIYEYTFTSDSVLTHDEFVQQTSPTYTLTITTTVGGTTNPLPGTYTYTANSSVQLTAIPNVDYAFDHWELDTVNVGSANPYTVLMDNNHTLTAVFTYSPPPPSLSASISPLSASILVDQSVTFTSTVSGGYTPYSYQWYLNGNPVSGTTSASWVFTPTTSGIYYVHLKVTDAKGNTAQSDTARITAATVPVGGYSIPIQVQTKTEPIIPYIALIAILIAIFTKLRPKTKRKR